MARKFQVTDAASFVEQARTISQRIALVCVAKEEIDSTISEFDTRFQSVMPLPRTHELHCVRSSGTPYHCTISDWSEAPGVDFLLAREAPSPVAAVGATPALK